MFKRQASGSGTSQADTSHAVDSAESVSITDPSQASGSAGAHHHVPTADETIAAVRKTKMGGMLLLVIVLGVSALLLFSMRKLGVSQRLDLPDIKIDYPIEQADTTMIRKDHEKIIKALRSTGDVIQVPLAQVQMNPFALPFEAATPTANGKPMKAAPTDSEMAATARAERKRQAESKIKTLKLNSVLAGKVPVAQISGQVVRVGDIVAELFIVGKIQGRSVTLVTDGQEYELNVGE